MVFFWKVQICVLVLNKRNNGTKGTYQKYQVGYKSNETDNHSCQGSFAYIFWLRPKVVRSKMPICPLHNAARRRLYLCEQAETKWRRTICYKKHSYWRFPSKLCVENYCTMTYGNIVSCSVFERFWIRHWLKVNVAGKYVTSILVRLWIWESSSALKIDKNFSRMWQPMPYFENNELECN